MRETWTVCHRPITVQLSRAQPSLLPPAEGCNMRHAIVAFFLALGCFALSWRTGATENPISGTLLLAATANAISPEELLPAASFLAARYDGSAAHSPQIRKTADWRALEETRLMDRVLDLLQTFATSAGEQYGTAARQLVDHVRRSGLTAAMGITSNSSGPFPVAGLVLHQAGRFAPLAASLLRNNPPESLGTLQPRELLAGREGYLLQTRLGLSVTWWDEDGHLAIGFGDGASEWMLASLVDDLESLDTNPTWQQLRKANDYEVTSFAWFDVNGLVKRFESLQLPPFESGVSVTVQQLLQRLGLKGLENITVQTGFQGAVTWQETCVNGKPAPGLLQRYLKPAVLKLEELPPLPENVSGFSAAKLDMTGLMDDLVRTGLSLQQLTGADMFQGAATYRWVEALVGGYTFRQFLSGLGDVWCEYNDPMPLVVPVGYSPVLAVSVRDQQSVVAGLFRLEAALQPLLAGTGQARLASSQKDDRSYWTLAIEGVPVAPTLMLTENWLTFAMNSAALESFASRAAGRQGRWAPSEQIRAAFQELPQEFGSVTVSDPAPAYRQLFTALPAATLVLNSQVLPNLSPGLEVPFGPEDMPDADAVVEPMFPNVSVGYATETGYAWKTRQSVPGTPVGNISATSVVPVLIALAMPAVQQAREAARRTRSKNNLKWLGLAMHNYHDVWDHFPTGTLEQPDLPVEQRLSWAYSLLPYMEEAAAYESADRKQGWQGPGNAGLVNRTYSTFRNPSQFGERGYGSSGDYVGIAGVGANAAELPDDDPKAGIFGYNRSTNIRSVTDGTSNTIMITDASQPSVSMFAGGRQTIRGFSQQPYLNGPDEIGSPHQGIVHGLLADGSIRTLPVTADPKIIEALATKAGGEVIDDF